MNLKDVAKGIAGWMMAASLLASAASCSSSSSAEKCTPGASVSCTGAGGCAGAQVCSSDGSSYGNCACGGAGDDAAADGGSTGDGAASVSCLSHYLDSCKQDSDCVAPFTCLQISSNPSKQCHIGCESDNDCAKYGAGNCEMSALASNWCGTEPTCCTGNANAAGTACLTCVSAGADTKGCPGGSFTCSGNDTPVQDGLAPSCTVSGSTYCCQAFVAPVTGSGAGAGGDSGSSGGLPSPAP